MGLNRYIYGNVDVVLIWLRIFKNFLPDECNLVECKLDPCIMYTHVDSKLTIFVGILIYDSHVIIPKKQLQDIFDFISKEGKFNINTMRQVKKYLGVSYEWKNNEYSKFVDTTTAEMLRK